MSINKISSKGFGNKNTADLRHMYEECTLCPRNCHADRTKAGGFCKAGSRPRLAKAMLHKWEEPCIAGTRGSGAIFFSGCTLKCIYCQNFDISHDNFGADIDAERLADIVLELQDSGAQTVEFITGTQFIPDIIYALDKVKHKLDIPTVFNCGGYESEDSIKLLDGYIDVYLPDIKYFSDELAFKYSGAPHYFETAAAAVHEMIRQTGKPQFGDDGIMTNGVIIRHLVLPNCRHDSIRLMEELAAGFDKDSFLISLMSQYTPFYKAKEIKELSRRLTSLEYDSVLRRIEELGFNGFMQEKSSAKEEYTPVFDLSGVMD